MSEQAAQNTTAPKSVEDRVADMMFGPEADAESPVERQDESPAPVEAQDTDPDDLSDVADQLPDDDPAPTTTAGELELQYNGQPLKVDLEQARTLAQKGKYFEDKEAEAERHWQTASQMLAQAQAVAQQMTPQLMQAQGTIALYDQALGSFDMGEMRRLARDDPAAYLDKQAERESLLQQRNAAVHQFQQLQQEANHKMQEARQGLLSQEQALAQKLLPRLKSAASETTKTLVEYLQTSKVRQHTVEAINNNAELLAMAYKASQYDKLQQTKQQRLRDANKAPQTLKPGSTRSTGELRAQQANALRTNWKKAPDGQNKKEALLKYVESKFI